MLNSWVVRSLLLAGLVGVLLLGLVLAKRATTDRTSQEEVLATAPAPVQISPTGVDAAEPVTVPVVGAGGSSWYTSIDYG